MILITISVLTAVIYMVNETTGTKNKLYLFLITINYTVLTKIHISHISCVYCTATRSLSRRSSSTGKIVHPKTAKIPTL